MFSWLSSEHKKLYYQSPIDLQTSEVSFRVSQKVKLKGTNRHAEFIPDKKIYHVKTPVFISINDQIYKLHEYHFHAVQHSEHAINGQLNDAEVHYVFMKERKMGLETSLDNANPKCVCDGECETEDVLVIGRLIEFGQSDVTDLSELQVKVPEKYFLYDGSLTASVDKPGNYPPVRWIVGKRSICLDKNLFTAENSKTSRPLQPIDHRLILFVK